MTPGRVLRIFSVAAAIVILRIGLQAFVPPAGNPLPPSVIVRAGLLPVAFTLYAFLGFALLAVVFVMIQGGLPGTKLRKGLTYGLSFGVLWAVLLMEPLPYNLGISLIEILAYPFADGVVLVVLGLLSGRFLATDSPASSEAVRGNATVAVPVIAGLFLAGRYLAYTVAQIYSAYTIRTLDTISWAAASGVWIGVMYLLLERGVPAESPITKAAFFGILVFGVDLFFFIFFIPLVFETHLADTLIRTVIDILSVTAGVFVFEEVRLHYRPS